MKSIATGLVFLSLCLFAVSSLLEPSYPYLSWLRAFSEASLVGALADWFAVTALFRHPMGIPIPHTAIVPKNKDRFGETLGVFVQQNFLSESALKEKLERMNLPKQVGEWLEVKEKNEQATSLVLRLAEDLLFALQAKEAWEVIKAASLSAKGRETFGALLSRSLGMLTQQGKLASLLIPHLEGILTKHEQWLRSLIERDLPWYVPGFLHDHVYKKFIARAKNEIQEASIDTSHPLHQKFEELLQTALDGLATSPTFEYDIKELFSSLLDDPKISEFGIKVLQDLREALLSPEAHARTSRLLFTVGERLRSDYSLQKRFTAYLIQFSGFTARTFKNDISSLISDTIKSWDAKTIVEKIENSVGRDLQFIRINGTLVGGLIGILIHAARVGFGF